MISKGVLAILSLLLMALGFWLAPQQLNSVGLAARNKQPDQLAYYLSIGQGVVGFLNLVPLAVSTKRVVLYLAYAVASALLLLPPIFILRAGSFLGILAELAFDPHIGEGLPLQPPPAEEGTSANHKRQ